MARILVISSYVARGLIGLGATGFALQRLGHEVVGWPTIVLSNHPGHQSAAALPVPAAKILEMLDVERDAARLSGFDAVMTGYLPSAGHVAAAIATIGEVQSRRPDVVVCVDPILGDAPADGNGEGRLYIDAGAAAAVRGDLVPQAHILTPNRFELAWLSGRSIDHPADAVAACRTLGRRETLLTSAPASRSTLANVLVTAAGAWQSEHPRLAQVPHGTGDFLAGLYLAARLHGLDPLASLAQATAGVRQVVEASANADDLRLIETQAAWATAGAAPVAPIDGSV